MIITVKRYLEVGKIVSTQGLKGELRVEPWCDNADFLKKFKTFYLGSGENLLDVVSTRTQKNISIIKFKNIDSIEEGRKYIGKILYIDRDKINLEDGRYFIQDLIDMEVIDNDNGTVYGKIKEVLSRPANDVYVIINSEKKEYLLPVIPDIIIKTDIENNKIYIRPIKGIFEDED